MKTNPSLSILFTWDPKMVAVLTGSLSYMQIILSESDILVEMRSNECSNGDAIRGLLIITSGASDLLALINCGSLVRCFVLLNNKRW